MSKYKPLSDRLARHEGEEWRASFAELEEVLGFPLPKSAREQNAWWSGAEKPHHAAWTQGGWGVGEVDRAGGAVVFRRTSKPAAAKTAAAKSAAARPPAAPKAKVVSPEATPAAAKVETPAAETAGDKAKKLAMPAALIGGAAAVLAGAAAMVAGVLAKRKGEPWR